MICCPQMPSHNFIKRTFYMLDFLYTNTLLKCGLLWKKFAFCILVLEVLFNMDYGPYTEKNSIRSGVLFWGVYSRPKVYIYQNFVKVNIVQLIIIDQWNQTAR